MRKPPLPRHQGMPYGTRIGPEGPPGSRVDDRKLTKTGYARSRSTLVELSRYDTRRKT